MRKPHPAVKPRPVAVRPPVAQAPPKPPPAERGPWLWGRHAVLAALANPNRKLLRLVATEEAAVKPGDSMPTR